jgi:hypothetical protein
VQLQHNAGNTSLGKNAQSPAACCRWLAAPRDPPSGSAPLFTLGCTTGSLQPPIQPIDRAGIGSRLTMGFFVAHGYSHGNISALQQGLLRVAAEGRLVQSASSPHGDKYVIDGELLTPRGTTVTVRTICIIEADSKPRFVTAYPA